MARRFRKVARRYSPRRRLRRFRRGKAPMSLLVTAPVAWKTLVEPVLGNPSAGISGAMNYVKLGEFENAGKEFMDILGINFLGYKFSDGSSWWDRGFPLNTYVPIALGVVGHKLANKFGVNRAFKRIPFIGKYAQL